MTLKRQITALIVAGGKGHRAGGAIPKQYQPLHSMPLLHHTLLPFIHHPDISQVRVVISPDDQALYDQAVQGLSLLPPVFGDTTRQASVRLGLESLVETGCTHVLIHDAARPFVSEALISRVLEALRTDAGVIPTLPLMDTIKRCLDEEGHLETLPREKLWHAQTPQGFSFPDIYAAHQKLCNRDDLTDDASLFEALGRPVMRVEGETKNRKITVKEDLEMTQSVPDIRVGHGFDAHALEKTEEPHTLMILGTPIVGNLRLIGHSDADVGLHSLTDALLGTIGDGDIGQHFPPSDPKWRDADSTLFLKEAAQRVQAQGGIINHVDVTIVGEAPRIAEHRSAMRGNLAACLSLDIGRISVKATTTDKLGFLGRGEGLAAQATATVIISR